MAQLASPGLPGPWVEMGRLAVGTCGQGALSSGWAPSLVSQTLLNGHLDQLLLTQAAVQAVLLVPDGALCARGADLRGHVSHLSPRSPRRHLVGRRKQQIRKPCEEAKTSWSLTIFQNSYVYPLGSLCCLLASTNL